MSAYARALSSAFDAFAGEAAAARVRSSEEGGRLVAREAADAALRRASEGTAARLPDADLLSVFAERPALLDPDERLSGGGGPRGALREALAAALRDDMEPDAAALVAEGQDADTLPEACAAALGAADASAPYPLAAQARAAFGTGAWDDPAVAVLVTHLAAHLEGFGLAGVANDLRAAYDGRDLAGRLPGPR